MKIVLSTVLLWGVILMGSLNAQNRTDTLRVVNRDVNYLKITSDNIRQLKKDTIYRTLIGAFKTHLASIREQIPEYLSYRITYVKDQNMIVEEVTGTAKYKVENGKIADMYRQNVAILQYGNLIIELYFNEIEELYSTDYELMIYNALSEIKAKKKWKIMTSRNLRKSYTYSYSENKLYKGNGIENKNNKLGVIADASIGVYKNRFAYEYGAGLGYFFGRKNEKAIFGFISILNQFNREIDYNEKASLWGVGYRVSKYGSIDIAFPYDQEGPFENLGYRIGLSIYTFRGIPISFYIYNDKDQSRSYFGFKSGLSLEMRLRH